jgi:hypothetical protein
MFAADAKMQLRIRLTTQAAGLPHELTDPFLIELLKRVTG